MSDVIEKMLEAMSPSLFGNRSADGVGPATQWAREEMRRYAQAALTILEQEGWQRVPEGSVVVPREPSEAMIDAIEDLIPWSPGTESRRGMATPEQFVAAMISAGEEG